VLTEGGTKWTILTVTAVAPQPVAARRSRRVRAADRTVFTLCSQSTTMLTILFIVRLSGFLRQPIALVFDTGGDIDFCHFVRSRCHSWPKCPINSFPAVTATSDFDRLPQPLSSIDMVAAGSYRLCTCQISIDDVERAILQKLGKAPRAARSDSSQTATDAARSKFASGT